MKNSIERPSEQNKQIINIVYADGRVEHKKGNSNYLTIRRYPDLGSATLLEPYNRISSDQPVTIIHVFANAYHFSKKAFIRIPFTNGLRVWKNPDTGVISCRIAFVNDTQEAGELFNTCLHLLKQEKETLQSLVNSREETIRTISKQKRELEKSTSSTIIKLIKRNTMLMWGLNLMTIINLGLAVYISWEVF